jgi:hypothetical protein
MLLLADLLDLQDERRFALDVAGLELPAREDTIRTMEEVLEERERWAVDDGVKGGEKKEKS